MGTEISGFGGVESVIEFSHIGASLPPSSHTEAAWSDRTFVVKGNLSHLHSQAHIWLSSVVGPT